MRFHLPKDHDGPIEIELNGKIARVFPGDNVYVEDKLAYALEGRGYPLKKGPLNGAGDANWMDSPGVGRDNPEAQQQMQQRSQGGLKLGKQASIDAHDDGPPIEGLADIGPPEGQVDPDVGWRPDEHTTAAKLARKTADDDQQQARGRAQRAAQQRGQQQGAEQQRQQHGQHQAEHEKHGKKE